MKCESRIFRSRQYKLVFSASALLTFWMRYCLWEGCSVRCTSPGIIGLYLVDVRKKHQVTTKSDSIRCQTSPAASRAELSLAENHSYTRKSMVKKAMLIISQLTITLKILTILYLKKNLDARQIYFSGKNGSSLRPDSGKQNQKQKQTQTFIMPNERVYPKLL